MSTAQTTIDIVLDKQDRVYYPGSKVTGTVVINSRRPVEHTGMSMHVQGVVSMQLSAKSVGLFEAFYSPAKPIEMLSKTVDLKPPRDRIPEGRTELPFQFVIEPIEGQNLYDTYHGVFIRVEYHITADLNRSMLAKNIKRTLEFILENPKAGEVGRQEEVEFDISPSSITNVDEVDMSSLPAFQVKGKIHFLSCNISKPFTGEIAIVQSEAPIRSIELQLVRVESCGYSEGMAKEPTEIQTIQIVSGQNGEDWKIPIYMLFPRLFTCPTVNIKAFKIEFEVNVIIHFDAGHVVTETFPITLWRDDRPLPHVNK